MPRKNPIKPAIKIFNLFIVADFYTPFFVDDSSPKKIFHALKNLQKIFGDSLIFF